MAEKCENYCKPIIRLKTKEIKKQREGERKYCYSAQISI